MPTRPPVHRTPSRRRPRPAEDRPSAWKRGYDDHWRAARLLHLHEHPLCQDCLDRGLTTPGEHVHHTAKLRDYPEERLNPAVFRTLCVSCHTRRTNRGE